MKSTQRVTSKVLRFRFLKIRNQDAKISFFLKRERVQNTTKAVFIEQHSAKFANLSEFIHLTCQVK